MAPRSNVVDNLGGRTLLLQYDLIKTVREYKEYTLLWKLINWRRTSTSPSLNYVN